MIYKIKSDIASAVVNTEGAMLNSMIKNDIEYLWQGDKEHWAGQAPVCFPICGVLIDGKAQAFGKKCEMSRHGVARINPFDATFVSDNCVEFTQVSDDNTKAAFPFDYELKIRYTIVGDTVSCHYFIRNIGEDKLPFVVGGHPAFNCPLDSTECFEDYKVLFDKVMNKSVLRPDHHSGLVNVGERFAMLENSDTIQMDHNLFEENDAMIFDNVESKCATLIGPKGKGIKIEYQDMNNLLIWSACNKANFVALEPWTGISNCSDENDILENKRGMTILEKGQCADFKFKMTMI